MVLLTKIMSMEGNSTGGAGTDITTGNGYVGDPLLDTFIKYRSVPRFRCQSVTHSTDVELHRSLDNDCMTSRFLVSLLPVPVLKPFQVE
jgi:hypothetical protein